MDYISCFSGIGGLEGSTPPIALCEIDKECQSVLQNKFPDSRIHDDVRSFQGFHSDVVVGGWPCQDISVAGKQKGLAGENSGLFYAFTDVSVQAGAHTIISENVPNLLRLDHGAVFREVLNEFFRNGYKYCAWRTLNARQFSLPHNRSRIFIVASKIKNNCFSLFRDLPAATSNHSSEQAAGFYWTAGTQSICYTEGYVPTIKVGSGLSIASPPAVHFGDIVRQLSPPEALSLQGFDKSHFENIKDSSIYRMTGNAVALPIGRFVVDAVLQGLEYNDVIFEPKQMKLLPQEGIPPNGFVEDGFMENEIRKIRVPKVKNLAINLSDFLDLTNTVLLSKRAANGLMKRVDRSGQYCPENLRLKLESIRDN